MTTKTLTTRAGTALIALSLAAVAAPASAQDSLPGRAVTALGIAIASQGDAALVQIRRELKDALRDRVRPYLPRPDTVPGTATDTPVAAAEDRAR